MLTLIPPHSKYAKLVYEKVLSLSNKGIYAIIAYSKKGNSFIAEVKPADKSEPMAVGCDQWLITYCKIKQYRQQKLKPSRKPKKK